MIEPGVLFSEEILNFQVSTLSNGTRAYINLDNAATTPPLRTVENRVRELLQSYGSVHRGAGEKSIISTLAFEESREVIRKFIGASQDTYVVFTGNTTVGMNMLAHYFSQLEGKIAVSKIEHSSSWLPWVVAEGHRSAGKRCAFMDDLECYNENVQALGRNQVIRYDLNDRNDFDLNSIESILSEQPVKAIVITASSNLTGYVPNIREISSLAHKYRAYVVVDGCQFIQHHRINMVECGIDFLIASGHKFYAPYGAGFIAGPKSFFDSFLPYQIGGGNLPYIDTSERFYRYQSERAHEPGTPNTVGAVSMAVALQELDSIGIEKIEAYESDLTRRAFLGIKDNPRVRVLVREDSLTTVLPFIILDMDPHMAARRLNDEYGIGVRAGTFCMFDSIRNLLGIQSDDDIVAELQAGRQSSIPGILRASFSIVNSYDDVDNFVMAVNQLAGSHCEVSTSGEDIYSGSINQPEAHAI